ncbi:MAG: rhomboid family intramembrane serine protease [Rikenellaceae bacterium]|nr:rhomboid family intramembrane serine protease [Rikenellaceae bacterium]
MQYRRFGTQVTPPVVKNLIIINLLMLMACRMLPIGRELHALCALYPAGTPHFHSWQVVTYMFLHADFSHLFFNMFALWMFGRTLEYELSSKRFLTYYMACGIGAALIQLLVCWLEGSYVMTVGASGAVFGILLAFGMMHPNNIIMLMFPPIPIKAKWFVVIYGVIELLAGVSGRMDNVAHFAHLGGMIWGFLLLKYWKKTGKIFY